MHRIRTCLLLGGVVLTLAAAGSAVAAPVTVQLRIEGPATTLFEGPVTTDVRTFHFTGDATQHQCDGTTLGGTATSPQPTRGAALMAAADQGLTFTGSFGSFGASFDTVGGVNVAFDGATNEFLVEDINGQPSNFGACSEPISAGDDVLFAYSMYGDQLLGLTGATTIAPGQTASLKVKDLGTAAAVAGATVDGRTSGADGTVTVGPYTTLGDHKLKATKTGSVRSNAVDVCVTAGADGFCGTTKAGDPPPTETTPISAPCQTDGHDGLCGTTDVHLAASSITIEQHQKYAKGRGPRGLSGTITPAPSGIKNVELRLTRNDRGKCATFIASTAAFTTIRPCGAEHGTWFSIGAKADWSYLLPKALTRGRYVLDVRTTNGSGAVNSHLNVGHERTVFYVG